LGTIEKPPIAKDGGCWLLLERELHADATRGTDNQNPRNPNARLHAGQGTARGCDQAAQHSWCNSVISRDRLSSISGPHAATVIPNARIPRLIFLGALGTTTPERLYLLRGGSLGGRN
jgi:hypothetical protein